MKLWNKISSDKIADICTQRRGRKQKIPKLWGYMLLHNWNETKSVQVTVKLLSNLSGKIDVLRQHLMDTNCYSLKTVFVWPLIEEWPGGNISLQRGHNSE